MKKFLFLALLAACACGCTSNKYTVRGEIADFAGTVYLLDAEGTPLDSAMTDNGRFRFEGVVETPVIQFVADKLDGEPAFIRPLIVEPGTLRVEGNIAAPQTIAVTGTASNDANQTFNDRIQALLARYQNPEANEKERAAVEEEFAAAPREALEANTDNYFGLLLLAQQLVYEMDPQEILDVVAAFPENLRQTTLAGEIKKFAEGKMRTDTGKPYIDIVQPDPAGAPLSLQSVVENPANRYVLVDFWASWCSPCMREMPYLVAAYDTYHDKGFEIYGVSFDTEAARWKGAIDSKGLRWIHVSELNRFDNQAAQDYAVNSIPANFLIDTSTGTIVATNLRGEALGEQLAELLQ